MKKLNIKFATCLAVLFSLINICYAQTVNTYTFNYEDASIGKFKLLTTDVLTNTLDYSKDSVLLSDTTRLETVSFFTVSSRLGQDKTSELNSSVFIVFPNPFTETFEINYESQTMESGKIRVFDALGRKIIQENHAVQPGMNHYAVDLSSYKSGVYFVTITAGNYQETKRVIKN